ncbi:MAG: hypothetical protein JXR03_01975 [Cyclobacteriaceae bacterium]
MSLKIKIMVTNTLKYNLLVSLFLIGFHANAWGNTLQEKRSVIEKSYRVDSDVVLKIDNRFGDIHVENWDRDEISVEVEILVRSRSEDRANKIMDRIEIEIYERDDVIRFETDSDGIDAKGGGSESFEINYTVKMNAQNPIEFENKFGDIYLPERNGSTDIIIKYGNLKADGMNEDFEFDLSFGGADIDYVMDADMDIQYSNLKIGSAEHIEMEQKFSNMEIDEVMSIDLETKYGEVRLGEVTSAIVDAHYSAFKIQLLLEKLVFEGNYVSGFEIEELSSDFELVDLSGQYTSYRIRLEEGLVADIEAEFSYSRLSYSTVDIDFYYKDFDGNKKEYKGRINGGDGGGRIYVNSSYGDLHLKEE